VPSRSGLSRFRRSVRQFWWNPSMVRTRRICCGRGAGRLQHRRLARATGLSRFGVHGLGTKLGQGRETYILPLLLYKLGNCVGRVRGWSRSSKLRSACSARGIPPPSCIACRQKARRVLGPREDSQGGIRFVMRKSLPSHGASLLGCWRFRKGHPTSNLSGYLRESRTSKHITESQPWHCSATISPGGACGLLCSSV